MTVFLYLLRAIIEASILFAIELGNGDICPLEPSYVPDTPDVVSFLSQLTKSYPDLVEDGCQLFLDTSESRSPRINESQFGALTPFWAQEAIGAPEAKSFLDLHDKLLPSAKSKRVSLAVLDRDFRLSALPKNRISSSLVRCSVSKDRCDDPFFINNSKVPGPRAAHASFVSNLIIGNAPIGTGSRAYLMIAKPINDLGDISAAVNTWTKLKSTPQIVNLSMGFDARAEKELLQLGESTIVVAAAGNESFFSPSYITKPDNLINVASLAPDGTLSSFTTERTATHVVIGAPSDMSVLSRKDRWNPRSLDRFGGTSGAAPLVTGSLSNVQSLLPDLTRAEAKALLQNVAIQTAGYLGDSGMNGAGVVNAYKMIRVAANLQKEWPKNRAQILDPNSDAYDFKYEVKSQLKAIAKLEQRPTDCRALRDAFRLRREIFFLDPENLENRNKLSAYYASRGFHSQAHYYADPAKAAHVKDVAARLQKRDFIRALTLGDEKTLSKILIANPKLTIKDRRFHVPYADLSYAADMILLLYPNVDSEFEAVLKVIVDKKVPISPWMLERLKDIKPIGSDPFSYAQNRFDIMRKLLKMPLRQW
jgi:hypothetical protein